MCNRFNAPTECKNSEPMVRGSLNPGDVDYLPSANFARRFAGAMLHLREIVGGANLRPDDKQNVLFMTQQY
jgi:hypothetical protein